MPVRALAGLVGGGIALIFGLTIAWAAVSARHGGSDEQSFSLGLALLIACLPLTGSAIALLVMRASAAVLRTGTGRIRAVLLGPSLLLTIAGIAAVFVAWY